MVTIRMGRVSCKLALVIIGVLVWSWPVAATTTVSTNLTSSARATGYTFNIKKLAIGVPANAVPTDAKAWLRHKKHPAAWPDYLQPVGKTFVFQLQAAEPMLLAKPLWLSRQLANTPTYRRSFYYYDRTVQQWVALPTTLDPATNQLRAQISASGFEIAVFDDTRYLFGPTPTAQFKALGDLQAVSAIAIDEATGNVLYQKNANAIRSIASLTKLMTAYVVLQQPVNFSQVTTYHNRYNRMGGGLHVTEGETMTLENLLYGMVVGSANNAAIALVDQLGYSPSQFTMAMDQAATDLGLQHTSFADPSGLEVNNLSTAAEYAEFLQTAWDNTQLTDMSTTEYYSFSTINTKKFHDFNNTDSLFRTSNLNITGSKTGYIDEALYCLALKAKQGNHEVITVILGAPSSSARFNESERLMQWAFKNYDWGD